MPTAFTVVTAFDHSKPLVQERGYHNTLQCTDKFPRTKSANSFAYVHIIPKPNTLLNHRPKPSPQPQPPTTTSNTTNTASHPFDDATIPPFIYILGAPGAGKGTLCALLAKHFTNIQHLSVGDLLRDLQANPQTTAPNLGGLDPAIFKELMKDRTSLPAYNIIAIVETALKEIASNATTNSTPIPTVLIDGFPRTLDSAELVNTTWGLPRLVFVFGCPRALAEKRFLNRARSEDDSVEIFRRRCDAFEGLNPKIVALYGERVVYSSTRMETAVSWEVLKTRVRGLLEELGSVEVLEM